jgi:hypothetical protein
MMSAKFTTNCAMLQAEIVKSAKLLIMKKPTKQDKAMRDGKA